MPASSVHEHARPGSPSGESIRLASGSHARAGSGPAAVPAREHHEPLEPRQVGGDEGEAVEERVGDHQRARLDEVDRPAEELALVGRVDGAHDGAGLEDPEPHRDELGAVGQQHADRLAGPHTAGDEPVGHPVGAGVHLAVADPGPVGEAQVLPVGVLRGPVPQVGEDPAGRVLARVPIAPIAHAEAPTRARAPGRGGTVASRRGACPGRTRCPRRARARGRG